MQKFGLKLLKRNIFRRLRVLRKMGWDAFTCKLVEQGFSQGSCLTFYRPERFYAGSYIKDRACKVTLKWEKGIPYRVIKSIQLSRPEDYLSVYQSGCNFSCLKCHSWEFTQYKNGKWMSTEDIFLVAKEYVKYVTVVEPRYRATSFHAQDLCKHCGECLVSGKRSSLCPRVLSKEQIVISPQGYGPARNIIAFTGGDLACNPEWYGMIAERIKAENLGLWILFETNGYGLTPKNLDFLKSCGIDAFWLDIKAWDNEIHKKLTGCENTWILRLPEEILKRDFVLEVLSLYIPGWVETDQIEKIAKHLAHLDPNIPFTILAFFGEYKLKEVRTPTLKEMLEAYHAVKEAGLKNIRLGNIGVFVRTQQELELLLETAKEAI